jgi:hypothetical protein
VLLFTKKACILGPAIYTIPFVSKKPTILNLLCGIVLTVLLSAPQVVVADEIAPATNSVPPVLITEIQTGLSGSGNASKEFIELYNTTDQPIDISDWQLWYISGTASQTKHAITLQRLGQDASSPTILAGHAYYLLAGSNDASYLAYLGHAPDQYYTATLSDNGSLRLLMPNQTQQCIWDVEDQVGWGTTAVYFEQNPASTPLAGQSLQRQVATNNTYIDTYNTAADFVVSSATRPPTPAALNDVMTSMPATPAEQPFIQLPIDDCTPAEPPGNGSSPLQPPDTQPPATISPLPPETTVSSTPSSASASVFPAADIGLHAPQITELLPNPASPQTDASDEFIELYNGNDVPFDLSGFELEVGLATKHHYAFPAGTMLQSKSFKAFFSSDTHLSMSNTSGQVWLIDPLGNTIGQSAVYGTAKDGQAWALANSSWFWTGKPTPNAANVITAATTASSPKKTASTTAKKSTAKTASTKTKASAKGGTTATTDGAGNDVPNPLHPAVLAIIGGFAVLYGAYEYRQDVANKFYQLRANRIARRETRQGMQGERGYRTG